MEVHFYLPKKYWPDRARQEAWKEGKITPLEQGGKAATAQAWIYQTWLALSNAGSPVKLTDQIPAEGVLISLAGLLAADFEVPPDVFFADVAADSLPHPAAALHILQNASHAHRLAGSLFMPHWPQPHLIPRDDARGDVFRNIRFYGDPSNLAPELRDAEARGRLQQELGVDLTISGSDQWHDYEETDCVVAIRGFGPSPHLRKPATKLYNAWLARVPFIGGRESAYFTDGKAGEDFLQAGSKEEFFRQIRSLRDNPVLRRNLVAAGSEAGKRFDSAATLKRWEELLRVTIPSLADRWKDMSAPKRAAFRCLQKSRLWLDGKLRR